MITLNRPCPVCKQSGTVSITGNDCACSSCQFKASISCPICSGSLQANQDQFQCPSCLSSLSSQKLGYLIENSMQVDHNTRCQFCGGPTIHRKDVNLNNRCFFFPKCSGQSSLFGSSSEALTFLDFETTGLEVGKNNVIEFGALKIDEDGNEHTFQAFVRPKEVISEKITQITGIDAAMVEGASSLEETMQEFALFSANTKLVAHNADFDIPWLVTASLRYEIPLKIDTVICTLKWAREAGEPRCSLGALTKKYAIAHTNAHRALADAVATKEVYFIFENSYKNKQPQKPLSDYKNAAKILVEKYRENFQP